MTPGHDEERSDLEQLDPSELDLLAYLDGELEGEALSAFESRLEGDRELAARLTALTAIGDFVRDDASRIYGAARVDSIVDDVMARVKAGEAPAEPRLADVIPLSTHVAPLTSREGRATKNTVIWVAFGTVAAAAAALIFWTGAHEVKTPTPVASTSVAPPETVAKIIPPPPPSNPPVPVPENASTVEVEDLEVGSGATVVYTRGEEGNSPVVWITGREAK